MYAYRRRKKVDPTVFIATTIYLLFAGLLSHVILHLQ